MHNGRTPLNSSTAENATSRGKKINYFSEFLNTMYFSSTPYRYTTQSATIQVLGAGHSDPKNPNKI